MFGCHSLSNDVGQILQRGFSFPGGLSGLGNTDKNSRRHLDLTVAHFTSGMKMHFFVCDQTAHDLMEWIFSTKSPVETIRDVM